MRYYTYTHWILPLCLMRYISQVLQTLASTAGVGIVAVLLTR